MVKNRIQNRYCDQGESAGKGKHADPAEIGQSQKQTDGEYQQFIQQHFCRTAQQRCTEGALQVAVAESGDHHTQAHNKHDAVWAGGCAGEQV